MSVVAYAFALKRKKYADEAKATLKTHEDTAFLSFYFVPVQFWVFMFAAYRDKKRLDCLCAFFVRRFTHVAGYCQIRGNDKGGDSVVAEMFKLWPLELFQTVTNIIKILP
jgi:hypothetical protein